MRSDTQFSMEVESDEKANTDPDMTKRVMQTILITAAFFTFGLMRCQEGVIFLDLVFITGSDVGSGSSMFTATALGLVLGILLICPLFDKFNNDMVYCACLLGSGMITLVMPLCKSLLVMTVMFGGRSFFIGPATSGSSVLMTRTWLRKAGPFLQNMQLFFALGGLVAPFIAEPFLMERLADNLDTSLTHTNESQCNTSRHNLSISFEENIESRVHVTFLITGGLLLVVATGIVLKMCLYTCKEFDWFHKMSRSTISETEHLHPLVSFPVKAKLVCYTLLGLHCVSYGCVVQVSIAFLMTFVVQYLGMSKKFGSLANTVFWGGQVLGRLLGIYLIKLVLPRTFLIVLILGLILTFGAMLMTDGLSWGLSLWWVLVGCTGLFVGPINATTVSWLDTSLTAVTGKLLTFVLVSIMAGMFTHIPLVGYLFENIFPMWFVYLLFIHSILLLVTFLGLIAVIKYFARLYCPRIRGKGVSIKDAPAKGDCYSKRVGYFSAEGNNLLERNDADTPKHSD